MHRGLHQRGLDRAGRSCVGGRLVARQDAALVVPPALLAGCGADYPPGRVLAALDDLGFAEVTTVAPTRRPCADGRARGRPARRPAGTPAGPVIVPVCPAIVNLVELRFPSLVGLLAPSTRRGRRSQAASGGQPSAYVVSCPSQRSVLARGGDAGDGRATTAVVECLVPDAVRAAADARN